MTIPIVPGEGEPTPAEPQAAQTPVPTAKRHNRMALWIGVGVVVLIGGVWWYAAGVDNRPGSPDVYDRIERSTSCTQLQREFDTAEANHTRDLARGRTDLAETSTSYMTAADKRMREIGCY